MAQKPPHFIWEDHKSDEDDRLGWEGEISRNEKGPGPGRGSDGGERRHGTELPIPEFPLPPLDSSLLLRAVPILGESRIAARPPPGPVGTPPCT